MDTEDERSVRVIVEPVLGIHDGPEEAPSPKPIGRFAAGVVVLGLIAGLWFVARPMPGTDAADQPITEPATTTSISPSPIVDGDTPDPFDFGRTFPMPATGVTHVAALAEGWIATGEPITAGGGPTVLTSPDGLTWRAIGEIPDADRVLQLEWDGDVISALVATDQPGSTSALNVVTSVDGVTWSHSDDFGEPVVAGPVQTGSLLGSRWVVAAAGSGRGTVIHAGTGAVNEIAVEVAPPEAITSYTATTTGFVAVFTRLDLASLGSTGADTRLVRWTANWGLQDITSLVGPSGSTPDAVASGGRIIAGRRLFQPIVPPAFDFTSNGVFFETEWTPTSVAPDGVPSLRLSLDGRSVMGVAGSGDDAYRIALPIDDDQWRAASLESDGPPELILATDTYAVVRVDAEAGRPRLVRLELASLDEMGEFRLQPILVGESPPFLAPDLDGDGFAGLIVESGAVLAFTSDDGLDLEELTRTDLPGGLFPIRLERDSAGYRVIARTGLARTSAFISSDGVTWEEIVISASDDSGRLEIEQISTIGSSRVIHAARGRVESPAVETYFLWSDGATAAVEVDLPCPEPVERCEVSSVAATADGFMAVREDQDGPVIAMWRPDTGWSSVPVGLPSVRLRTADDATWFLSEDMAGILEDDGSIGELLVSRPADPAPGSFVEISPDASTFVYRTDTALFVGRIDLDVGVEWVAHPVAGLELTNLLALGADAAVFRAVSDAGPGLMRFPTP